jgi:hypothetical protein
MIHIFLLKNSKELSFLSSGQVQLIDLSSIPFDFSQSVILAISLSDGLRPTALRNEATSPTGIEPVSVLSNFLKHI